MSNPQNTKPRRWLGIGKGRAAMLTAALALAIGGVAIAQSRPGQHLKLMAAEGGIGSLHPAGFRGGHGFSHGRHSPFADMTDEEMDRMIARGVAHAAIEIDASDEQRDAITALVTDLAGEMRAVPEGFRDAGARMRELLLAEDVDAPALEALRAERLAEADRVSRAMMATMVEVSGLLTPEQRKTVGERMEMFHAMRERRRHD